MRPLGHSFEFKTQERSRSRVVFGGLISLAVAAALHTARAADRDVPGKYATIQAAVDAAADGDSIRIAPGVYTQQVKILGKKLALIGQPGAILRATESLSRDEGPAETHRSILYARTSELTLRGLTFEGERLAGNYVGDGELRGVLLRGCNVVMEKCMFFGFREFTAGSEDATAFTVTADEGRVEVRVTDCTFADNELGLLFYGSATKRSIDLTIENNTIIGPGPTESGRPPAGIVIREGVGGRIAGNAIRGFSYTGTAADFPISFGIEGSHQENFPEIGILEPLEIEGNILRDNQVHISLLNADGSVIRNNVFEGSAPGIIPIGVAISGKNATIARNQFENMPEGIRLFGDDPMFGELVGIATNVGITSNRFCHVTKTVQRQRLATATESGTLACPYPDPALEITPSVLLAWPWMDDGFVVESSSSAGGPWTPLNISAVRKEGQLTVVVAAVENNRFFRLRKPTPP